MSRGFKRDHTLTQLAHQGMYSPFPGVMSDKRSFVSLPKFLHGDGDMPHLILYGKKDKGWARVLVFQANRVRHANHNRCDRCARHLCEEYQGDYYPIGEWDHVDSRPGERCDCIENSQVLCPPCHRRKHVKPQFGMGNPVEGEMSK